MTTATAHPDTILLATDLGARCDRALDRASQLALAWQAQLIALHALEPAAAMESWYRAHALPSWRRPADPLRLAERCLRAALLDAPAQVAALVAEGVPAEVILDTAGGRDCGLIVTGTARDEPLGRLFIGDTVDTLIKRARVPLLIVKGRARAPYRNIVVGSDFSSSSRHALGLTRQWFEPCRPTLFNAYDAPFAGMAGDSQRYREDYRSVVARDCSAFLADGAVPAAAVDVVLEPGPPAELLSAYVEDRDIELVVVGTHGRSAVYDLLIGSTARAIIDAVPCDILLVPEPLARPR